MTSVLLELYRHKAWATLRLIDVLRGLPLELLETTVPGTYGSVLATLRHLADNDAAYYADIMQQPVPARLKDTSSLDEMAERLRQLDPLWQALVDNPRLPERELSDPHGTALAVAPMAQAIHHADVHRAQIQTILGAHGISAPALDMWEYGAAAGYVRGPGG